MKKWLVALFVLGILLTVVACKTNDNGDDAGTTTTTTTSPYENPDTVQSIWDEWNPSVDLGVGDGTTTTTAGYTTDADSSTGHVTVTTDNGEAVTTDGGEPVTSYVSTTTTESTTTTGDDTTTGDGTTTTTLPEYFPGVY